MKNPANRLYEEKPSPAAGEGKENTEKQAKGNFVVYEGNAIKIWL